MSPHRRTVLVGLGCAAAPKPALAQLRDLLAPASGPVFDPGRSTTGPLALEPGLENAVFRGLLDGAPVRVLLDSGASRSVVDLGLARRLRLRGVETQSVRDTSGLPAGAVELRDVSLRLPGLTFLRLATVAVDLSPLAATGQEVPMILGAEAFADLVVTLDRAGRTVDFAAPDAATLPPSRVLPLVADGAGARTVPLEVEGVRDVPAQFDLGSQSPLSASLAFAQAHGWLRGKRVSTWAAASVAGVADERIATFEGVRLAGVDLPPTPVELLDRWDAPTAPLLVGYPLLSRFRLVADYPADRLWLSPGPRIGAPFRRDRSGLALRPLAPGGGAQVVHVAAGSPAARACWRAGEVIVAAHDAAGAALGDDWGYGDPGRTVALTTTDGAVRTLTLADYF